MKPIIMQSPNFGYKDKFGTLGGRGIKGRHGHKVKAIVMHVFEGPWTSGTRSWFLDAKSNVSYNDLILKNGDWLQIIDPGDPAWANGDIKQPTWGGLEKTSSGGIMNPNLYTHSISREGYHGEEPTVEQRKTLIYVAKFRALQHGLPLIESSFIGHRDINSVTRANCPGKGLNWPLFIKEVTAKPEVVSKSESNIHVVISGEIFSRIAQRYGLTTQELAKVNPHIKDINKIYPGDKLTIPVKSKEKAPEPEVVSKDRTKIHVVVSGEIFSRIAQRYGLTTQELAKVNPHIKNINRIFPGDKLIIPVKNREYIVVKGDTFSRIALRFGVSIKTLSVLNPHIKDINKIYPGDKIQIP